MDDGGDVSKLKRLQPEENGKEIEPKNEDDSAGEGIKNELKIN